MIHTKFILFQVIFVKLLAKVMIRKLISYNVLQPIVQFPQFQRVHLGEEYLRGGDDLLTGVVSKLSPCYAILHKQLYFANLFWCHSDFAMKAMESAFPSSESLLN